MGLLLEKGPLLEMIMIHRSDHCGVKQPDDLVLIHRFHDVEDRDKSLHVCSHESLQYHTAIGILLIIASTILRPKQYPFNCFYFTEFKIFVIYSVFSLIIYAELMRTDWISTRFVPILHPKIQHWLSINEQSLAKIMPANKTYYAPLPSELTSTWYYQYSSFVVLLGRIAAHAILLFLPGCWTLMSLQGQWLPNFVFATKNKLLEAHWPKTC